MLSYEALDYNGKQIFLDIACFFVNQSKDKAMYLWEACHFCPEFGVSVLSNMCLIKIVGRDTIWMHSVLKDFGRKILDVLRTNEGEGHVEALSLAGNTKGLILTHQEMVRLPNLRFLELDGGYLDGNFEKSFSILQYLSWHYYPPDFKATNLHSRNLVVLDLSESDITDDWGGWNQIKMAKNLKVLDLTDCGNITRTPDFSGYLSLEKMILSRCVKLGEIDFSIGKMKHLTCLSLEGCVGLESLPREIGSLESSNELNLWNTRIMESPDSIGKLKKINVVMMKRSKVKDLPLPMEMVEKCEELHESQSMEKELLRIPFHAGGQSEREAMNPALSMLALAFCFIALASISPIQPVFFIAMIVLPVIADTITRTWTKPGLVSSPPVPPSSSSFSPPSFSSSNLSSISISSVTNPEVFLSFRGPDTCKVFADSLYTRLIDSGINVFRDSNDRHPGETICDALLEAIKQSKISIPIISKDYTSSRHCLMELAQMLECEKANNQLIVPIFYDINPIDLKYQCGCVGESLRKHENRGVDRKDFAEWKQALREIAETKGYDLLNSKYGHQGEDIKTVVSYILQLLNKNDLVVTGNLVGIEPHVREVMRKLGVIYVNEEAMEVCDKDVRVLGICGMPGIGKTTVAKVVYNKVCHLFQGCSYLANIRENVESNRLVGLQEQLISDLRKQECRRPSGHEECTKVIANSFRNMRVLILLDDVYDFDHIKHLVGNLIWFGPGSRILMTVRRKDVLNAYRNGVADKYEVEPLRPYQALQLFHKHAFRGCPPKEEHEYDFLFTDIIDFIGGLPPAIEATASWLCEMRWDIEIWREQFHNLGRKLDNKVKEAFEASYNSIDEDTREIFLDIACFFSGMDKRIPSYMWRVTGYYPSRESSFFMTCV
ncbi:disease resistance protein RPV1-like [Eucalyptus grandis]|uniref:disease resistance protein RPV1-like n=1 Tax=Eucalyptus grandis TaxID=71139 RepID=UPI00192EC17C|nr:disease resistance protein RPV1-like [Eucalyptus grandis]